MWFLQFYSYYFYLNYSEKKKKKKKKPYVASKQIKIKKNNLLFKKKPHEDESYNSFDCHQPLWNWKKKQKKKNTKLSPIMNYPHDFWLYGICFWVFHCRSFGFTLQLFHKITSCWWTEFRPHHSKTLDWKLNSTKLKLHELLIRKKPHINIWSS